MELRRSCAKQSILVMYIYIHDAVECLVSSSAKKLTIDIHGVTSVSFLSNLFPGSVITTFTWRTWDLYQFFTCLVTMAFFYLFMNWCRNSMASIFICISLNKNHCVFSKMQFTPLSNGSVGEKSALVYPIAWCWEVDEPSATTMIFQVFDAYVYLSANLSGLMAGLHSKVTMQYFWMHVMCPRLKTYYFDLNSYWAVLIQIACFYTCENKKCMFHCCLTFHFFVRSCKYTLTVLMHIYRMVYALMPIIIFNCDLVE